ncbi:cytochrome b [Novosphingobium colocasiae]|uniref:Cytochrome b561 bacterial/Ni-hydrogenase domain-containing protein n=1 Tax=Novosphingobium colocasiae TaxID=1256513 RepID=A0A918PBF3_9SPHN|nr:cytochrome b [Novosphingobium colocasiae]GGY96098.1 hypothetical protein GCM10011614_08560 [Novosphingobium colocasiae]
MNTTASARYTRTAIVLHWLIAVLILANFALAWGSEDLSKAAHAAAMGYHKSIGLSILALSLVRLFWRIGHKAPPYLPSVSPLEARAATVTTWGFYALMIAIPLSGWAMVSGGQKPLEYFGLFPVAKLPVTKALAEAGHESHEVLAFLFLALLALHLAGALKHRLIDKDGTLQRMM